MPEISFGHWLAGFVDGEGCFQIRKTNKGGNFSCRFVINLRADDKRILGVIQEYIGYGIVESPRKNRENNPCVRLSVESKEGCLTICDLFSEFPLRAKKQRDFAIWKEAVGMWAEMSHANSQSTKNDWGGMAVKFNELRNERKYHA